MPSDFSATGRSARELIPVPELSMESIRNRSHSATRRGRLRTLILCGAICLSVLITGTGLAAKIYDGVSAWVSGGKAAINVPSAVMVFRPTASDVRNAIANASFPVVFPTAIPAGTRVSEIAFAPAGHTSFVYVYFENERARFNADFLLVDSAVVNANDVPLSRSLASRFHEVSRWRVGRETVLVPKGHISSRDLDRIKLGMMKASPAASLRLTNTMLWKTAALSATTDKLGDVAERYAKSNGRTVLFNPNNWQISKLVKERKPMLDTRILYLTSGMPNYAKAPPQLKNIIAVSPDGVRAIDAVLRSTHTGSDCGCEILFNQHGKTAYWIWKIPLSSSAVVRKYSVDAKTFVVTPSTAGGATARARRSDPEKTKVMVTK